MELRGIEMTENEAIEIITNAVQTENMTVEQDKALSVVQKVFEEIQQYRAIGTVEECWEAVEKQKAKKILNQGQGHEAECLCPTCRTFLGDDQDWYYDQTKYCGNCGQKLEEY